MILTPLRELWLSKKGHIIDDIKITEDDEGLHVRMSSHKPSELEPDNELAYTYSNWSFLIPKDKCKECIWIYQTKNQPIMAVETDAINKAR